MDEFKFKEVEVYLPYCGLRGKVLVAYENEDTERDMKIQALRTLKSEVEQALAEI
jgi:hypothetical protein